MKRDLEIENELLDHLGKPDAVRLTIKRGSRYLPSAKYLESKGLIQRVGGGEGAILEGKLIWEGIRNNDEKPIGIRSIWKESEDRAYRPISEMEWKLGAEIWNKEDDHG